MENDARTLDEDYKTPQLLIVSSHTDDGATLSDKNYHQTPLSPAPRPQGRVPGYPGIWAPLPEYYPGNELPG